MTKIQRIWSIFFGLIMVAMGVVLPIYPKYAFAAITILLGLSLFLSGFRQLIYYFTMARHMVGGRTMLYRAVIVFDMGMFTLTLTDIPTIYVMLYLIGIHAFSGTIDILLALESKRSESAWKLGISHGIMDVLIALLCLAFLGSVTVAIYIYSFGLCYSGVMRIIRGVRRTAIVYIQ